MRRAALIFAGGALWLLLAAVPVLADGGPHVANVNNGTQGINADSCAGCHRAHTASGPYLITAASTEALCLTCHGSAGVGATTDVTTGIQYKVALTTGSTGQDATDPSVVLGALRGGGFVTARIGSGTGEVTRHTGADTGHGPANYTLVPALAAGQPVTSAHLALEGSGLTPQNIVWGNGDFTMTAYAGTDVSGTNALECTTCHNPHGNGQYRILNPVPSMTATSGTKFLAATADVTVADDTTNSGVGDETRNYTIHQTQGGTGTLTAAQVEDLGVSATSGDYFHRKVPWNATTPDSSATLSSAQDAPNGDAANFDTQINAWCASCHTRYMATGSRPYLNSSGDAIFNYRHSNTKDKPCTTCHVAHGSNATMDGTYSANEPFPGQTVTAAVGDSRLLKIDNRGTCQACHDPTGTVTTGTQLGPTPVVP